MKAGRLRHRVDIEERTQVQDPNTGAPVEKWVSFASNVPAAIEPLSAREFVASQAVNSEVSARITLRWRPGLRDTMRIVHIKRGERHVYDIEGRLADKDSGLDYVTLAVSRGVSDGQ